MSGNSVYYQNQANFFQREAAINEQEAQSAYSARNDTIHKYNKLVRRFNALAESKEYWEALARENANGNKWSSNGNTVAGFTNNLAQEIAILRGELTQELSKNKKDVGLALPYGRISERTKATNALTQGNKNYINLRLLCRIEWYDWCQHVEVLAKASQASLNAFLEPNATNSALRKKEYIQDLKLESEQYHALRDAAMDPKQGEKIRADFEQERYKFWESRLRIAKQPDKYDKRTPDMIAAKLDNPGLRFDLHLPAGRLAAKWKIDITTGNNTDYFRELDAANTLSAGIGTQKASEYYV